MCGNSQCCAYEKTQLQYGHRWGGGGRESNIYVHKTNVLNFLGGTLSQIHIN
jgi:hypothetical protein